jgi:hypothetical protein
LTESLVIGWVCDIKDLHFEGGKHRLKGGEIILQDDLTGLAILRIEIIDLGCRGLRKSRGTSEPEKRSPY